MAAQYFCNNIPEDSILYEFKGNFNTKAFEDDTFVFNHQFHIYFQTSTGYFRAIKSPFQLGDVFIPGQLDVRKKHISVGPIKVFIFHKEVLFVDAWSLHYEYQRKLNNTEKSYFGEYKFYIESPLTFLQQFEPLFGAFKDVNLLEFSSRFNQLIQHDVFLFFQTTNSQSNSQELEESLHEVINHKFEPYGIVLTQFTLNSSQ